MKMAAGTDSSFAIDVLLFAWTTEQLKHFLRQMGITVSGLKHKLITKAKDFIEMKLKKASRM